MAVYARFNVICKVSEAVVVMPFEGLFPCIVRNVGQVLATNDFGLVVFLVLSRSEFEYFEDNGGVVS